MNVASLELCKELHELSGWGEEVTQYHWYANEIGGGFTLIHTTEAPFYSSDVYHPAYDLGYLLRKLPVSVRDKQMKHSNKHACLTCTCEEEYICGLEMRKFGTAFSFCYVNDRHHRAIPFYVNAPTPEDAAAKLAIELFKQGVLTRAKDINPITGTNPKEG